MTITAAFANAPSRDFARRLIRVTISCCVLTAVLAPQASAQAEKTAASVPWSLTLGVDEQYDSNVSFSTAQTAGDLGSRFGAHLARDWDLRRGRVTFGGDARQLVYRQSTSLNQFTYGLEVGVTYLISPRLSWRLGDAVTSAYAQDSRPLLDAGLVFPKVLTRVNVATSELTYDLSRTTQVRWRVGQQNVSFNSPAFSAGSNLSTGVSLTRTVTQSQTVGVRIDQSFATNGTTGDVGGLLGTWQLTGNSVTLAASMGIRPYTLPGHSGYLFAPGGSIGVTGRLPGPSALGLRYERAVEQAYGISTGTHLAHRVTATYVVTAGRRVTLDASANYGLNTYPLQPDLRLEGRTAAVGLRYLLVQNLSVGGQYTIWVRRDQSSAPVTTYRDTVSLLYGVSWR
jgi:hypothetical protein